MLAQNSFVEELICFHLHPVEAFLHTGGRFKKDRRHRSSNVSFDSIRVPPKCKKYQFPLKRFMSARQAKSIITTLNSQRWVGTRNFRPTRQGVANLLTSLGMGSRDTSASKRLRLKFLSGPFPPSNPSADPEDLIDTASTNGLFLKVNTEIITSSAFERQPGHWGYRRPRWVTHYATVIIHEVGHVVHKRFQTRGRRYVNRVMGGHRYPDCFLDSSQFDSRKEWSEWFADMFTLSLINLAKRA